MHRFLCQMFTFSGKARRIFHSYSVPNPLPPHISASFLNPPLHPFHPWRSEHTIFVIFRGLHSGSVLSRHFMFSSANSLLRISGERVRGFRPKLLRAQFHGKSSDANRSSSYNSGGRRSWFKGLTAENMVFGLIAANVVVFLSWKIATSEKFTVKIATSEKFTVKTATSEKFMSENFTISWHNISCGRMHTLITSAFSHIDIWHIAYNMLDLYFFGIGIGRALGPEYLLKLYLAGAIGGSVFYLAHQAYKASTPKGWRRVEVYQALLGANGAANAITMLHIFLYPRSIIYLDFTIPIPATLLGIYFIGSDVWRIIKGDNRRSVSAQLGGVAVAAIAWARIRKGRF